MADADSEANCVVEKKMVPLFYRLLLSRKVFRPIAALVAVSIAVAFANSIARLDSQAADSSEIRSSIQDEMTRAITAVSGGAIHRS